MEISLKRNHGFYLVVKADNVNIEEDIEKRVYSKDENGKTILPPKSDIDSSFISMFADTLSDIIYYRKEEFDSSSLIEQLFEKLPIVEREKMLFKLNRDYSE